MNLNEKDRLAIAEYVYSYQTDVLIKSDAITLIDVLEKHGLIDHKKEYIWRVENKHSGISEELMVIIEESIPKEIGEAIMDEYFGRSKYSL